MDEKEILFAAARLAAIGKTTGAEGIGRLSEKSIHRIFKLYIEPNELFHEVSFLGSIADIKNSQGIYEIQTRSLFKIIPKLQKFLEYEKVTVVIPVVVEKTIRTFNEKTGEISSPRKSPLHESVYTAFADLYDFRAIVANKNLSFKLILVKADEYKYLSAKKGTRKIDKIPTALVAEYNFSSFSDYLDFIPFSAEEEFSAKELCIKVKCPSIFSTAVAGFLRAVGALLLVRREGSKNIYRVNHSQVI